MAPRKQRKASVPAAAAPNTDLYGELGLARDASIEDIKRAYRRLALQCHPDKCPGDEAANERFQRISMAYSVLSDEQKRRFYDQNGTTDGLDISPDEFLDMFQSLLLEIIGGADMIRGMLSCFTPRELARLPPFPFPKELFPSGTFPPGLRFSSKGLKGLPPQIDELIQSGDLYGMFAAMSGDATPGPSGSGDQRRSSSSTYRSGGGGGRSRAAATGGGRGHPALHDPFGFGHRGSVHAAHATSTLPLYCLNDDFRYTDGSSGSIGSSDSEWTDVSESELEAVLAQQHIPPSASSEVATAAAAAVAVASARGKEHAVQGVVAPTAPPAAAATVVTTDNGTGPLLSAIGGNVAAAATGDSTDPFIRPETPESLSSVSSRPSSSYHSSTLQSPEQTHQHQHQHRQIHHQSQQHQQSPPPPRPSSSSSSSSPLPQQHLVRDWMLAARSCDVGTLARLLEQDSRLLESRGTGMGHTALHWCAAKGSVEALSWLLRQGMDVNVRNDDGATPLHAAARNGRLEAVEALLTWRGRSPAATATATATTTASTAMSRGADLTTAAAVVRPSPSPGGATSASTAAATVCDLTAVDGEGRTALQLALDFQHVEVAALLLRAAAAIGQDSVTEGRGNPPPPPDAAVAVASTTLVPKTMGLDDVAADGGGEGEGHHQAHPTDEEAAEIVRRKAAGGRNGECVLNINSSTTNISNNISSSSSGVGGDGVNGWNRPALAAVSATAALASSPSGVPTEAATGAVVQEVAAEGHCRQGLAGETTSEQLWTQEQASRQSAGSLLLQSMEVGGGASDNGRGSSSTSNGRSDQGLDRRQCRGRDSAIGTEAKPLQRPSSSLPSLSPLPTPQVPAVPPPAPLEEAPQQRKPAAPAVAAPASVATAPAATAVRAAPAGDGSNMAASPSTTAAAGLLPLLPSPRSGQMTPEEKAARRAALLAADAAAEQEEARREAKKFAQAEAAAAAAGLSSREEGKAWLETARRGDLETLQRMLAENPRLLGYQGQGTNFAFTSHTALHWAVSKGHTAVARWLLQQGADPDLPNAAGATPLHAAARQRHGDDCSRLLVLEAAAKMGVPDALGETVRDILMQRDDTADCNGSGSGGGGSSGGTRLVSELELLARVAALRDAPGGTAEWTARTMRGLLAAAGINPAGLLERRELADACKELISRYPPRITRTVTPASPAAAAAVPAAASSANGATTAAAAMTAAGEAMGPESLKERQMEQPAAAPPSDMSTARPPPRKPVVHEGDDDDDDRTDESQKGNGDMAAAEATSAAEAASDAAKQRGNSAFSQGDFSKAVSHYTMAIRLRTDENAVLYSNRAAAYCGMRYYGKAQADAEAAIQIDPRQPKYYCRLGVALLGQLQFRDAEAAFRAAIKLDPTYAAAIQGLQDVRTALTRTTAGH